MKYSTTVGDILRRETLARYINQGTSNGLEVRLPTVVTTNLNVYRRLAVQPKLARYTLIHLHLSLEITPKN